ncbi:MAG: T9SS type B sorting domain-containing protein [Roseivirga sp.]|nr:T9SS type B sorting domain-containing protein [Roseivirga sp.]
MKRGLVTILILCCWWSLTAQTTTEGKDFWMGFMENIHDPPGSPAVLQLSFSAKETANVTVEGPRVNYNWSFIVPVGETFIVEMPIEDFMPTSSGQFGMGIHITSDVNISVYALNKRALSADAAVILPTNALGNDYVVFTHTEAFGLESQVLIVASADDTRIEVTPSQDLFDGKLANQPFIITMSKGETYQLKSAGDLSGTLVKAFSSDETECKNFAVFGGTKMTFVGSCGANADHLYEQMFPTSTWGQEFLFVPYASRSGGDMLKVGAKEDNTIVNVEGLNPINLNAGEVRLVSLALDGIRSITSNKPVSMAQFARSQDCDNRPGDPFMIMLSPMEQRIQEVTFRAFEAFEIEQYYLTLITRNTGLDRILLDNTPIGGEFVVQGNNAYARLEISQGNHVISAPDGVIAYVYGFGNIESFGYSAGVSLTNTNLRIQAADSQINLIDEVSCFNSVVTFNALFDTDPGQPPKFSEFDWDFGDGNTAEGVSIQHTYDLPGTYDITLVASDGSGACSTSETVTMTIDVTKPEVTDISGPQSVCPEVTGIVYSAEAIEAASYEWTVVGGTMVGDDSGISIVVDWGSGNPNAAVSLVVLSPEGCRSEAFDLPVLIDNRLQPDLPSGPSSLCFSEREGVTYNTSSTNGSMYEWFVSGGSFVGSNLGNEVTVNWNDAQVKTIWFRETNPAISDCSGDSPVLAVEVKPELILNPILRPVSCANGDDGQIEVQIQGGVAPYFYRWSTGLEGEGQSIVSDVEAGSYSLTVVDAVGCEEIRTYEITQPTPLIVSVDVQDVSCFNGSDGEVTALVSGGTAPYTFQWNGAGSSADNVLNAQPAGTYSLRVLDANDCEFILGYVIVEPEPLTATTVDNPSCPGESTGSILVQASGGTAPYFYRWNTSPPQDQQLIEGLPAGIYSVTVTDANGCTFTIEGAEVLERFPVINVPNAFSPNGDGQNDGFSIVSDCNIPVFEMKVYNSWGLMIFHTNSSADLWDGIYQGTPVPAGKYTYHIAYKTTLNGQLIQDTLVGVVSLLR